MGSKVIRDITKILKTTSGVIFGRKTAGTGRAEELSASDARTVLGLGTLATQSGTFSGTSSGTNTGDQNLFSTITISGQSDVVADSTSDTLTLVGGTNITLTTNASTDTITIASTAGGLSGTGSVDNAVLRADGTGGATLQSSALVIDDLYTASPNNTVNAVCIGPIGGTTNVDFVLKPKGTGAVLAQVPDSTTTGGNKRGANAVDLQTVRSSATHVASGANSVLLGGSGNTASGTYAVAGGIGANVSGTWGSFGVGRSITVSGQSAFAFGYGGTASGDAAGTWGRFNTASGAQSTAFGYYATASTNYCLAHGLYALADKWGQRSHAAGRFAATGDAQGSEFCVRNSTTDATQAELFLNGSSLRITMPNDTTWAFSAMIVGRRADADNESAAYRVEGCIDRNGAANTTALVGSVTVTALAEDNAAWDVTAVADSTNGALVFNVTGEALKTVKWFGWVRCTQVTG